MAPAATNLKIEDLRARLKADPKSRLFFPLAEELRKIDQLAEAEQVLRTGLTHHPTYLSAWVSLGRVLHELQKEKEAVEALSKALQLDPGNVVAARLLGDAHLALGDKVEAIKKYKLVRALLPVDDELDAKIEDLDRELNPVEPPPAPPPAEELAPPDDGAGADVLPFAPPAAAEPEASPFAPMETPAAPPASEPFSETSPFGRMPSFESSADEGVFGEAAQSIEAERRRDEATGDAEPMRAAHSESPFEEPASGFGYGADAMAVEEPPGMHAARPPLSAELPIPLGEPLPPLEAAPPVPPMPPLPSFGEMPLPPLEMPPPPPDDDLTDTLTMADLHVRQGLIGEARQIYENILQRDPMNLAVREKLDALADAAPDREGSGGKMKKEKLERWLAKVGRREG